MKNINEEKHAAQKKKYEELKKQQNEEMPEDLTESDDTHSQGIIPERNFKKNLGCG
ncbi:MAG: hypothetical protein WBA74_16620 [Cyclobacteriaceae bacterium]